MRQYHFNVKGGEKKCLMVNGLSTDYEKLATGWTLPSWKPLYKTEMYTVQQLAEKNWILNVTLSLGISTQPVAHFSQSVDKPSFKGK